MDRFAGKYKNVKAENYREHLLALGAIKDASEAPAEENTILELKVDGNRLTVSSSARPKGGCNTVVLNEEVEENPDGRVIKTTLKLEGDNLVSESKLPDGSVAKRIYSLSGDELTMKLTNTRAGIPDAVFIFKKL